MRVIVDVNLWVSFCIGQHLDELPFAIGHPTVELFICKELENEFADVAQRPRLAKYIRMERVAEVFQLMEAYATRAAIVRSGADFVDEKDNYLLDFSHAVQADYLVTGDRNLLNLEYYFETRIISFKAFLRTLNHRA